MKTILSKIFKSEPINIFPNPATKGKVVNLVVKNAGHFSVELVDGKNALLHTQSFSVSHSNEVKLFNIPSEISNGLYYIKVVNVQNRSSFTEPIIVL